MASVDQIQQLTIGYASDVAAKATADKLALEGMAAGAEKAGKAVDGVDQTARRAGASMEALGKKYDGATAATAKTEAANRAFQRALEGVAAEEAKAGGATEATTKIRQRATAQLELDTAAAIKHGQAIEQKFAPATAATNELAKSSKAVSFAMRDLGLQSIDMFQGIATGQPIFRTLIQQGSQVAQVNAAMGVGFGQMAAQMGAVVARFAPFLGIAAVVAGVVGLGVAAETSARQLNGIQNALRATRNDYVSLASEVTAAAKAIAATTGIGTSDARAAGQTIAGASNFSGSQEKLESLIKTAGDLAVVMGKTIPDAAKDLASALQDPGAEAQKLANDHFPGMSQALAYSIKMMADGGDKAGAFARELKVIQDGTKGASDNLTPLQLSIQSLSKAFTTAGQDGRSLADVLGTAITNAAAAAVNALASVVGGIQRLRELGATAASSALPQGAAALTPDATGRQVLVNPQSGAVGMFQVMPSTAAGLRLNPYVQDQNIMAGLQTLQQYGGGTDASLARYGGYGTNVGAASGYIGKVRGADVGKLPADVASQIEFWGQVLGMSPEAIAIGQRIAVVESGGRQYAQSAASAAAGLSQLNGYPLPGPGTFPGAAGGGKGTASDDAFKLAQSLGGLYFQTSQNEANQGSLTKALVGATDPDQIKAITEALDNLKLAHAGLITEQEKLAVTAKESTLALSALSGYERTMAEVDKQFTVVTKNGTIAIDERSRAISRAATQIKLATDYSDTIRATNDATAAQLRITAAYDGTAASVSHAQNVEKAYQQARLDFDEKAPGFTDHVNEYAAALDRSADAALAFQRAQASVNAVSDAFKQAFDTIGNAITQAFIQGQGAAVNWGNVLKAVISQVIQKAAELAVINPILNSVFGQNNGTLGTAVSVLAGGASSGSSSGGLGGLSSLYQLGSGASSVSGALGGPTIMSSLGLTGTKGLLSNFGGQGVSLLNTPIFAGTSTLATSGALEGSSSIAASGATDLATTGAIEGSESVGASVSAGGLTYGGALGALGGIAAGYGIGSTLGGFIAGGRKSGQQNSQYGAAAGAIAGAVIGSVVPVIGTVLGGIIGGTLGGGAGGFIGPANKSPYSLTNVGISQGGLLSVGSSANQLQGSNSSEVQAVVDAFNQVLTAAGARIANQSLGAGLGSVGEESKNPTHAGTNYTAANVGELFSRFRYSSEDPHLNAFLTANGGAGFSDIQTMATVLSTVRAFVSSVSSTDFTANIDGVLNTAEAMGANGGDFLVRVAAFVTQTVPAMTAASTVTGTLTDAVKALTDTYAPAIAMAQQLGYKEQELTDARDKAITTAVGLATEQTRLTDAGFVGRYLTARATNDNDPAEAQQAALFNFDLQATAQKKSFLDNLVATFGDAYKDTQQYVDQTAYADLALNEERKTIQKQFGDDMLALQKQQNDDSARQTASATVVSISDYIKKFSLGSASPLSANSQFDIASRQFDSVANSAIGGNFAASQQFTTYADSLATSARTVYGSGAGYAAVVDRIVTAANQIASQGSDMLTASVQRAEIRTQTQILGEKLDTLTAEVTLLRQQTQQAANIPARAA